MTNAAAANCASRPLGADDLERVTAIDRAISGHARRHFFEKRFGAAEAYPDDFIHIGVSLGDTLSGFAIARVLRGEFGHERAVAVLDAIGVQAESRERGIGHMLMHELGEAMRKRDVRVLQSQAEWTNHGLLRFFDSTGFSLAPRLTVQRAVATTLDETLEEI